MQHCDHTRSSGTGWGCVRVRKAGHGVNKIFANSTILRVIEHGGFEQSIEFISYVSHCTLFTDSKFIIYTYFRNSTKLVLALCALLQVVSLLRCLFYNELHNNLMEHIAIIDFGVILIGLVISNLCLYSILNFIQFWILFGKKWSLQVIQSSLAVFSIIYSIWLFIQVREHWIQFTPIILQYLQFIPTFLSIHSNTESRYVYSTS